MDEITELMEAHGFEPDHSDVATLMEEQHTGAGICIGFALLGDDDND